MTDLSDAYAPLPPATRPKVPAIFLTLGALVACASLILGLRGEIINRDQDDRREQDRVESDIDGCERTNDGYIIARAVAISLRAYVDDVLAGVENYAQLSEAERAVIDLQLVPAREAIDDAIEGIVTIDCSAVVPGASG